MAKFYVKEVTNSGPNVTTFRRVSRQASGESFNPRERSRLFFAYERHRQQGNRDHVIGVASYTPADWTLQEPGGQIHEDSYFHVLSFLFVDPYCQSNGCGTQILQTIERDAITRCKRSIRILSAEKAVGFFRKNKYTVCGEVLKSACSGSPLFNRLVPMEKIVDSHRKAHGKSRKHLKQSNQQAYQSGSAALKTPVEISDTTKPKAEKVLQWNICQYEIKSTENWDDE